MRGWGGDICFSSELIGASEGFQVLCSAVSPAPNRPFNYRAQALPTGGVIFRFTEEGGGQNCSLFVTPESPLLLCWFHAELEVLPVQLQRLTSLIIFITDRLKLQYQQFSSFATSVCANLQHCCCRKRGLRARGGLHNLRDGR